MSREPTLRTGMNTILAIVVISLVTIVLMAMQDGAKKRAFCEEVTFPDKFEVSVCLIAPEVYGWGANDTN